MSAPSLEDEDFEDAISQREIYEAEYYFASPSEVMQCLIEVHPFSESPLELWLENFRPDCSSGDNLGLCNALNTVSTPPAIPLFAVYPTTLRPGRLLRVSSFSKLDVA